MRVRSNGAIFAFLMAFGVLMHKNQLAEWVSLPVPFLTALTAVLLLFRPDSPRLFLVFVASLLAETAWYAPFIVNHALLFSLIAIAILASYARSYRRNGRLPLRLDEIESDVFPVVQVSTILLFAFAVLHKLNHGYLDPVGSCALDHFGSIRAMFPVLPAPRSVQGAMAVIYTSLVVEAVIPALLLFRRTRVVALIVAFMFHYFIASHQARAFSALSLSLYATFLPRDFYISVDAVIERIASGRFGAIVLKAIPVAMTLLVLASIGFASIQRYYQTNLLGEALYYTCALAIFIVFLAALSRNPNPLARLARPVHAWQWALVMLVVINGLTPYLGLQTQNAFSMFSNLRTEDDGWNHVLLPKSMRVFTFQDSPITVLDFQLSKPGPHFQYESLFGLKRHYDPSQLRPNMLATEFEFRRSLKLYCAENAGPVRIAYKKDGTIYRVPDACAVDELRAGNAAVLEKILRFRHPIPDPQGCPGTT